MRKMCFDNDREVPFCLLPDFEIKKPHMKKMGLKRLFDFTLLQKTQILPGKPLTAVAIDYGGPASSPPIFSVPLSYAP